MRLQDQLITLPTLYHLINRYPLTISPDSYVVDAIILMSRKQNQNCLLTSLNTSLEVNICNQQENSCILVVEAGYLLGIITAKDVVNIIADRIDISQTKVAEVMVTELITLSQSHATDIFTAWLLLRHYQISYLPIVDNQGQLTGIVTDSVLLQAFNRDIILSIKTALQQPQNNFRKINGISCRIHNHLQKGIEPKSATFGQTHQELQQTRKKLQMIEEKLHQTHGELEKLVAENELLQQKIVEYQQAEEAWKNREQLYQAEKEAAVQESEAKFRHFAENIQSLIWWEDPQTGKFVYVNPAYEKIWGRSCESLYEKPLSWMNAVHPDDCDRVHQMVRQCVAGESTDIEYRILRPDGLVRWIWDRTLAIRDEQGNIRYYAGIAEDITDRKHTEESWRESEARLSLALEAAHMGIWDWNLQTNETLWSANMGLLYGLPNGTLCPTPEDFLLLIHPEDREAFTQAVTRTIEQGTKFIIEYRAVWPDGSIHWLNSIGQVYYSDNSQPIRLIGTTRDICKRKQAEQKILEQAALLNIATDAILVRNFQNQILFWNQGAERLYGWLSQEILGNNSDEFLFKQPSPTISLAIEQVIESGFWHGELHKVTKSGKNIIVESRWTLMRDDTGQPKSILIVDTDITQKKQLEEQFFRTQRLESLGTLAGGISHDLNNILTPILAAAQILQLRFPQNKERYYQLMAIIESNAKRGADLVKQVLSFARGFKGERTIILIKHLISEMLLLAKQTFPKSIEFAIAIPDNLWAISGDITQLHQVLMNLVVNARDAMPDGGTIKISAENKAIDEAYAKMNLDAQVGNYIMITIADTGIGMAPEILAKIFEPFFTTKEISTGTGLGLSTVLGIIKSHGGFINVSSKVGKGSKFKLFLPAIESSQALTVENLAVPLGEGELILVVDDEAQILEIATIVLENYNYKILTASNGIEAIALYAQYKQQIKVVLMDMMMPEMDGITAIRTLQKMNPQVQIIACSGLNPHEGLAEIANANVQLVLPKPFTAQDLLNSLQHVLKNQN
ncbi:PAS domain-containing protein [Fortiea sp. LEGE XX443]|uniref:PAS domain-containing protein n=1 Tax=Fortiea sp. LEGE XX443 TaxID=1828611 RepID=UPI001881F68A|nr:PAS domain-containing protein [Fortiea sp. LEGE XX443]MBE9005710.1 PAS domain-containing protein [Fortiea sp. LEGE XX443]